MAKKKTIAEKQQENEKNRARDHKNERLIRPTMDIIYKFLRITYNRIDSAAEQLRGADLKMTYQGKSFVVDEKMDTIRMLKLGPNDYPPKGTPRDPACTFCAECSFIVYPKDPKQEPFRVPGWFSDEFRATALNSHFLLIYINCDKDEEQCITHVHQLEVICISYDAWRKIIEEGYPDFNPTELSNIALNLAPDDDEMHHVSIPDYDTTSSHVVVSGQLPECPVNVITKKIALRKNALFAYAFNLEGELGHERIVSYRPTRIMPGDTYDNFRKGGWITVE